jgi:ATP-dependent DNA ligase
MVLIRAIRVYLWLILSVHRPLYYSSMPKSFPEWIEPMAATLTQERFTGPEWSFERKFDGIRLLGYKKGKRVELFSRNHLPQNLPAVSQAIARLGHDQLILDGEITWGGGQLTYHVFDIMWIDGREVMSLPLEERRELLDRLKLSPPLRRVTELPNESAFERAQAEGWEGVIAKRRGSIYEQRRSRNWLKMKCELAQEFVVGGFTDPQGKRVGLGALLVGYYEYGSVSESRQVGIAGGPVVSISSPSGRGRVRVRSLATGSSDSLAARGSSPTVREGVSVPGAVRGPHASSRGVQDATGSRVTSAPTDFVFAGKIGTGFNDELLLDLRRQLDALEIEKPPFTKAIGLPRLRAHWVRPEIVVQVGFIQWTKHNKLRHPRLLGVRHDKDPRDVVKE